MGLQFTWSPRKDITAAVKREGWGWIATGPVHGIQLKRGAQAGRLVIPCDNKVAVSKDRQSHVIYSDNSGATWKLGGVVGPRVGAHLGLGARLSLTFEAELAVLVLRMDGKVRALTMPWAGTL